MWAEGFRSRRWSRYLIFLLLLLSLVKSKWWMNSDLSERNRVAFCQKQRGVIFFLRVPGSPLLFLFLSRCLHCLSLFLFHSPCIHRLSRDFSASLYIYLCVLFNFNRWFFVIYNEWILNGVVVLPNNVIYTWLNFRWSFFLHGNTSLIVEINFLSAFAIIYSIWLVFNPHNAQNHFTY